MEDLEIGLIILNEFLDHENNKAERAKHALKDKKAADEAAALKVHDKLSCHLFFR